ncbi:hypothetical protein BH11ARM1_BH11ARM1_14010 [soil metagenome]
MKNLALFSAFCLCACAPTPAKPADKPADKPVVAQGQTVPPEVDSRLTETERATKPLVADLASALDGGDFRLALKLIDQANAKWAAAGLAAEYAEPKANALLGLNQNKEALDALGPLEHVSSNQGATCASLALLRLGREKEARAMYSDQLITRFLPSMSYRLVPSSKTTAKLEANIRLARGMDDFQNGLAKSSMRELKESDRLAPLVPLTSYFIGQLYLMAKDQKNARLYLATASKMPGPLGQDAKSLIPK